MATTFVTFDRNKYKAGDPITEEMFEEVLGNIDDLEFRLNQNESTGSSIFIFNDAISIGGIDSSDPFIFYHKATRDFSIVDFRGQIFGKNNVSSGLLSLDLQKSPSTNPSNFNSILNTTLSFNYATDPAFSEKTSSINSTLAQVSAGDVLRIEVKSTPLNFGSKILIAIGAE